MSRLSTLDAIERSIRERERAEELRRRAINQGVQDDRGTVRSGGYDYFVPDRLSDAELEKSILTGADKDAEKSRLNWWNQLARSLAQGAGAADAELISAEDDTAQQLAERDLRQFVEGSSFGQQALLDARAETEAKQRAVDELPFDPIGRLLMPVGNMLLGATGSPVTPSDLIPVSPLDRLEAEIRARDQMDVEAEAAAIGQEELLRNQKDRNPIGREVIEGVRGAAVDLASPALRFAGASGAANTLRAGDEGRGQALAEMRRDDQFPIASEIVGGTARSLVPMALAAPAGMAGITGLYATQAYDQGLREADLSGLTGADRQLFAGAEAAVEAGVMQAFNRLGLGGVEAQIAARTAARRGLSSALARVGTSSIQEIPEEVLTEALHAGVRSVGVDPDALDLDRLAPQLGMAAAQAVAMAGVVDTPNVLRDAGSGIAAGVSRGLERFAPSLNQESAADPVEAFTRDPSRRTFQALPPEIKEMLPPRERGADGRKRLADLLRQSALNPDSAQPDGVSTDGNIAPPMPPQAEPSVLRSQETATPPAEDQRALDELERQVADSSAITSPGVTSPPGPSAGSPGLPTGTPGVSPDQQQQVESRWPNYEAFRDEYVNTFNEMSRYTVDQAGASINARKLAEMYDANPEWADRVEAEASSQREGVIQSNEGDLQGRSQGGQREVAPPAAVDDRAGAMDAASSPIVTPPAEPEPEAAAVPPRRLSPEYNQQVVDLIPKIRRVFNDVPEQDAEDLSQQAITQLLGSGFDGTGGGTLEAYALTIAANVKKRFFANRKKTPGQIPTDAEGQEIEIAQAGGDPAVIAEQRDLLQGQTFDGPAFDPDERVIITVPSGEFAGSVQKVLDDGRVVVRTDNGKPAVRTVAAGAVRREAQSVDPANQVGPVAGRSGVNPPASEVASPVGQSSIVPAVGSSVPPVVGAGGQAAGTQSGNVAVDEQGRRQVGKNRDGFALFEDERGVRSFVNEQGFRETEPVQMRPTRGGVQVSVDRRYRPDFKTQEELQAEQPKTDSPSAPATPPARDDQYQQVREFTQGQKTVSAGKLQRQFGFGFGKAAEMIDRLTADGVIGESTGTNERQVLSPPATKPDAPQSAAKQPWQMMRDDLQPLDTVLPPMRPLKKGGSSGWIGEFVDESGVPIGQIYKTGENQYEVFGVREFGRGERVSRLPVVFTRDMLSRAGSMQVTSSQSINQWKAKKPVATDSNAQSPERSAPSQPSPTWDQFSSVIQNYEISAREPGVRSSGSMIKFGELRPMMGLDKPAFDTAIRQFASEGKLVLHTTDLPSALNAEERQRYVASEDGTKFYTGATIPPAVGAEMLRKAEEADAAQAKTSSPPAENADDSLSEIERAMLAAMQQEMGISTANPISTRKQSSPKTAEGADKSQTNPPAKKSAGKRSMKPRSAIGQKTQAAADNAMAELDAVADELAKYARDTGLLSGAPLDPKAVSLTTKLLVAATKAGALKFADAVVLVSERMGEAAVRKLAPYFEAGWKMLRRIPGYEGVDEAGSVEAVLAGRKNDTAGMSASDVVRSRMKELSEAYADHFRKSDGFDTIIEARKFAADLLGVPISTGTIQAKLVEEAIEVGVVQAARDLIDANQGESPQDVFDGLVDLYSRQPNLKTRVSESMIGQQYSTPAPLAYLASQLAGIRDGSERVYEPTAGNGMLLIASDPENSIANELDQQRASNLRSQGFNVTTNDAVGFSPEGDVDVVIANPPFGAVRNEAGQAAEWTVDGVTTREVDHAISLQALKSLSEKGRAVLILGAKGHNAANELDRRKAYLSKRAFYEKLYAGYPVVDHFTVAGDLYSRQGASFPVDVIVIDRSADASISLPWKIAPVVYSSWGDLKNEKLANAGVSTGDSADSRGDSGQPEVSDVGSVSDAAPATTGTTGTDGRTPESGNSVRTGMDEPRGESRSGAGLAGGRMESVVRGDAEGESGSGVDVSGRSDKDSAAGEESRPAGSDRNAEQLADGVPSESEQLSESFQVPYQPGASLATADTLLPANQASAVRSAIEDLQSRHGNIEEFVQDRLGFTPEQLKNSFLAEQVDALALAIDNHERGFGFIIGDQTGVGKGRVVAGMIHYARRNGMVPVFVTEKPDLFASMVGDLQDIGQNDPESPFTPLVLNGTGGNDAITLPDGRIIKSSAPSNLNMLRSAVESVESGNGFVARPGRGAERPFDAVFMTYSQMNPLSKKREAERRGLIRRLSPRAFLILDEAHNAGGSGGNDIWKAKDDVPNRAEYFREIVGSSAGVFYSSATFAKRSNVMDLYSRTSMAQAVDGDVDKLADAIEAGGVPLQQIVSQMLAESGQYIRREKSFDGIEIETKTVSADLKQADDIAGIFRALRKFDAAMGPVIEQIESDLVGDGNELGTDNAVGDTSVTSTGFSSLIHNAVDQMLFSLKADQAANEAIEAVRRGEKPVIAVDLTMESLLKEFVEDRGVSVGDPIQLTMHSVLMKYLERSRRLTIKTAGDSSSQVEHRIITEEEMDQDSSAGNALEIYKEIKKRIGDLSLTIPASPIDWIRYRLEKAGISVREVTGRTLMVDYSAPGNAVLSVKSEEEAGVSGKQASINGFNSGQVDALILNRSGSTGLSIHASQKFSDRRRRHMIVAQAAKNIDEFMQMLGRINRTGQIRTDESGRTVMPRYTILMTDSPAEKRPAALLAKKLSSLNAAVTSKGSGVVAVESPDLINEVGGYVIAEYLRENAELADELDVSVPDDIDAALADDLETLARQATGRLASLPVKEQQEFYESIEAAFTDRIETLNAMNANPLIAQTLDFQAKTLERFEVSAAKEGTSPFSGPAYLERVRTRVLVKPLSRKEVTSSLNEFYKSGSIDDLNQLQRGWSAETRAEIDDLHSQYSTEVLNTIESNEARLVRQRQFDRMRETLQGSVSAFPVGSTVIVDMDGEAVPGIVIDIVRPGAKGNPIAPGRWRWKIAVDNADRIVSLSGAALESKATPYGSMTLDRILERFEKSSQATTEERWIATGNALAAYGELQDARGSITFYTNDSGETKSGIVMPRSFSATEHLEKRPVSFESVEDVMRFFNAGGEVLRTPDGSLFIRPAGNSITLRAPTARSKGGKYTTNKAILKAANGEQFVSRGKMMEMVVGGPAREATLKAILQMSPLQAESPFDRETARSVLGLTKTGAANGDRPRGSSSSASADPGGAGLPMDGPVDYSPAEIGLHRDKVMARSIPLPEMVELTEILQDEVPKIGHRLRRAMGLFKSNDQIPASEILIRPDVPRDKRTLAQVLAHEIGHLIDWLPDNTLKRGNILGRIASLRGYLKDMIDAEPTTPSQVLTPSDRRKLRKQAKQDVGPKPPADEEADLATWRQMVAERYQELLDEEAGIRNLVRKGWIMEELVALSEWWKPYDHDQVEESYVDYRQSARELMADAMSVLINAPMEIQQRAPLFWKTFEAYLNKKPEVADAFIELWDRLADPEKVAEKRRERIRRGQEGGAAAFKKAAQERLDARLNFRDHLWIMATQGILDSQMPNKARARKLGLRDIEYQLDELHSLNSAAFPLFNDTQEEVLKPLQEAGVSDADIGEYLFANRIVKEVPALPKTDKNGQPLPDDGKGKARFEIANPYGFDKDTAQEQLDSLRAKLGDERFELLEDRMQHWHRDILWPHVEEAVRVGVYNQDTFERKLVPNMDAYAAFAVVKYIDDSMSPMIREQVGTFEDVGDPFRFTMLKFSSLVRLNQLNAAKAAVVDRVLPQFGEVKLVEVPFEQPKPTKNPSPGMEHLSVLRNGRAHWYEVPKEVADSFKTHDVGMMAGFARAMSSTLYKYLHPVYVTFSPGFLSANPFRDLQRTWIGLGSQHGISLRRVVQEWLKSLPEARRAALGQNSELLQRMIREKAFDVPYHSLMSARDSVTPEGMEIEKSKFETWVDESQSLAAKVLRFLRFVGETQEIATKMAGFKLLEQKGIEGPRRAFEVRKFVGTPDYKQRGLATDVTNSLFMYSKVKWNALQQDVRLATGREGGASTAFGYWWRTLASSVLPAMLTKAALQGLFGDDNEEWWKKVPAYLRDSYHIIPLGTAANGDAVFFTIPMDEQQRFFHRLTGHLIDAFVESAGGKSDKASAEKALREAVGEIADLVLPSANTAIKVGGAWKTYLTGGDPVDDFRNEPILPRYAREAGGTEAASRMLQWTISQTGVVGNVSQFAVDAAFGDEQGDRDIMQMSVKAAGGLTGFNRLLRRSSRGSEQAEWVNLEREAIKNQKIINQFSTPAIRRLRAEMTRLQGQPIEDLTPQQQFRRQELSLWYSRVYEKLTDGAENMNSSELSALRDKLKEVAKMPHDSSAVDLGPEARSQAIGKLIMDAVGPADDRAWRASRMDQRADTSRAVSVLQSLNLSDTQLRDEYKKEVIRAAKAREAADAKREKRREKPIQVPENYQRNFRRLMSVMQ